MWALRLEIACEYPNLARQMHLSMFHIRDECAIDCSQLHRMRRPDAVAFATIISVAEMVTANCSDAMLRGLDDGEKKCLFIESVLR